MLYIPEAVGVFKDHRVRRVLAPVINLAERHRVAVLVVRHLNKGEEKKAICRSGGSIGILGAARCALLAGRDQDEFT